MKRVLLILAAILSVTSGSTAQQAKRQTLDIYVVDTEGGKAALFVSPSGQTLLIDSGSPGERDAGRIMDVLAAAGVKQIDYLLSTHYHVDHIGGIQELAQRIPVAHYIDHGPTVEEREQVPGFQAAYAELRSKARHTVVKPGDRVPITGVDWRIVTAGGASLTKPLPGGGQPNPSCAQFVPKDITNDPENAQSIGSVVTYGQFRAIDLGDLLWNKEHELMCPNNKVGTVDLYLVTHHGVAQSGSEVLVHAVRPRVAVMQNGTRKGGSVSAYQIMRSSPGLEDIWQLHWSYNGGIEHNPAGVFIANVDEPAVIANVLTSPPGQRGGAGSQPPPSPGAAPAASQPAQAQPQVPGAAPTGTPPVGTGRGSAAAAHSPAHYIKISAESDGTFTVTNSRNGYSKTYRRGSGR